MEINVFGQTLKLFVFTPSRLSAWWKRSRETGCAPVPLSECLRSPRPHKCAPSATAASTAPSQNGFPRLMEKQIHMKEGLFTFCSLLLLLAESWGLTIETNLISRSEANAHNFIYIDLWFTSFSTSSFCRQKFWCLTHGGLSAEESARLLDDPCWKHTAVVLKSGQQTLWLLQQAAGLWDRQRSKASSRCRLNEKRWSEHGLGFFSQASRC